MLFGIVLSGRFSIAVFYTAVDEFHQLFVAGRGGRLIDVLIDSLGVVIGILVVRGIEMLYKVVYNRKRLKQADAI
ncbi:VanZ family protein [[Clostridium] scindens]|uniref:VanZ family protein n=1 Tax=Clostridium scindens (strain JCM 10418 / VPI 12708) TaxID=29347 RepID=UPI001FC8E937|nr:VanZ family protein [[Clostridium] scindens]